MVRVLLTSGQWMDAREIAAQADHVAPRTVRAIAAKLANAGIAERVEPFDGYQYRLTREALEEHVDYCDQVWRVAEATGVALERCLTGDGMAVTGRGRDSSGDFEAGMRARLAELQERKARRRRSFTDLQRESQQARRHLSPFEETLVRRGGEDLLQRWQAEQAEQKRRVDAILKEDAAHREERVRPVNLDALNDK